MEAVNRNVCALCAPSLYVRSRCAHGRG
ncbi:hypothetical protein LCGC14_2990180, partial [marine sediment metagenome]